MPQSQRSDSHIKHSSHWRVFSLVLRLMQAPQREILSRGGICPSSFLHQGGRAEPSRLAPSRTLGGKKIRWKCHAKFHLLSSHSHYYIFLCDCWQVSQPTCSPHLAPAFYCLPVPSISFLFRTVYPLPSEEPTPLIHPLNHHHPTPKSPPPSYFGFQHSSLSPSHLWRVICSRDFSVPSCECAYALISSYVSTW